MALATATGASSFDITAGTGMLDLSNELAEVIRGDNTSLISRLGVSGFTSSQKTHKWNEDSLNANTATLNEALDASETGVDVATDDGTKFKIGTLFKFNERGKTEVCRVTAISTDTLTVERGYGSTSGETHASGAEIMIISHTKQESWKPTQEDWTKERSSGYNYHSIFGLGIAITYSRQNIDHAGIASEFAHQTAYRLKEIMRSLDSAVINSIRSASEASDTDYGSLGGIIEFVSQTGGNVVTTQEDLTEQVTNALYKLIWDDASGAISRGFILVGGALKRVISTFDQAYRRNDFDSRMAGFTVEKFLTDLGFELEVIVDPWMPDDVMIIGDLDRIKVGPLQGDSMRVENLARTGRLIEAMVTGQYTMEVRNAKEAFGIHRNLA
jgi:hypothetical protein